jgi:hypothetical protein
VLTECSWQLAWSEPKNSTKKLYEWTKDVPILC